MKQLFGGNFFGESQDDSNFKPENNDIFLRKEELSKVVGLCSEVAAERFARLNEDKYNIDDLIKREGKKAFDELFLTIENDLKERAVLLDNLSERFDDETVKDFFEFRMYKSSEQEDYWDKINFTAYAIGTDHFKNYDLDQLRKLEQGLNFLNINEADVSNTKKEILKKERVDQQRKEKLKRAMLGKKMSQYFEGYNHEKLLRLIVGKLGFSNINTAKQLPELSLEKLEILQKMVDDVAEKTEKLGGHERDIEDLIMGFEEVIK